MSEWEEKFKGTIWQVVQQQRPDGRLFELAKRSPGVRVLITDGDKILLNKERRHELDGGFDLRLPGGKVYDDIEAWVADYGTDAVETTAFVP